MSGGDDTNRADRNDVKRQRRLDHDELKTGSMEHTHDEVGIEDVVMERPVLGLVAGPLLELPSGKSLRDASEIAERDELLKVCVVVLRRRRGKVGLEVL